MRERLTGEEIQENPLSKLRDYNDKKKEADLRWFWVPDTKYVWLPGRFIKKEGGFAYYHGADNSSIIIPEAAEKALIPLDRFHLMQTTHDLITIQEARYEAYTMFILANRYYKNKIYTNVSDNVLLCINPYKNLPIYSDDTIKLYSKSDGKILPPHIYKLAKETIDTLVKHAKSQIIIIAGESGSGKTETCKHIIKV